MSGFDLLPNELLDHLFSFLNFSDALSLSHVNRLLFHFSRPYFWAHKMRWKNSIVSQVLFETQFWNPEGCFTFLGDPFLFLHRKDLVLLECFLCTSTIPSQPPLLPVCELGRFTPTDRLQPYLHVVFLMSVSERDVFSELDRLLEVGIPFYLWEGEALHDPYRLFIPIEERWEGDHFIPLYVIDSYGWIVSRLVVDGGGLFLSWIPLANQPSLYVTHTTQIPFLPVTSMESVLLLQNYDLSTQGFHRMMI